MIAPAVDLHGEKGYNTYIRNAPALLSTAGSVSHRSDPVTSPIIPVSPDSDNLKRCTKCREWKSRAAFSLDSAKKDGLQPWCKACTKQYAIENADRLHAKQKEYRTANASRIREKDRRYSAANTERNRARKKQYYADNTERFHEYYIENAEKKSEYNHEYYVANKDKQRERRKETNRKYRRANQESLRESNRIYRDANAEKIRARNNRRKARERGLDDTFTGNDWASAVAHFNGCCAVCGRPPGLWHTLSADHWIPLSSPDCPGTIPSNIVPLCHGIGGCNNSKNDRNAAEWLIEKFGKRKGRAILNRIESYLEGCKPAFTEAG